MPFQHQPEEDLASEANPPTTTSTVEQELDHWEQLIFSLDMQNEQNGTNSNVSPRLTQGEARSHSDHTAALLAQLTSPGAFHAAGIAMLNPSYSTSTPEASAQASGSHPPRFNQDLSRILDNAGHTFQSPRNTPSVYDGPANPVSTPFGGPHFAYSQPYNATTPSDGPAGRMRPPQQTHQTHAGPSTSAASPEGEEGSEEYEDKRRRNTAASARFRIKKKQRTLALERSVSDLTGRAEDLEREASDLRRENGWLKEIVMLKGGRLSGVNFSGMNLGYPEQSGRSGGQPGSKKSEEEADQADDSEESEEEKSTSGKKKGKGKSKKK